MIVFQIIIAVIIAACLGYMIKFMDYMRRIPPEVTMRTVMGHAVQTIYIIIISIAAMFIYIVLEIIAPYIQ